MFTIDYKKIHYETGLTFDTEEEAIYYMQTLIDYLCTHNKNYTKQQDRRINDLRSILHSISDN